MVGAIINRSESCPKCGGYGHNQNICPTPGRLAIKDDGTSKPDPTKGREYRNRDDPDGSEPHGRRKKKTPGIAGVTCTGEFKWTPELGPCRHCGKDGHLSRDCTSDKAKAAEEGRKAARAAKVAAGATPAAIYAMDTEIEATAVDFLPPPPKWTPSSLSLLFASSPLMPLRSPTPRLVPLLPTRQELYFQLFFWK
jgi:hypothetical protein